MQIGKHAANAITQKFLLKNKKMESSLETMVFKVENPKDYESGKDAILMFQLKSARGHYSAGQDYYTEVRVLSVVENKVTINYSPIPECHYYLFSKKDGFYKEDISKFDFLKRLKEMSVVSPWKRE